MHRSTKIGENNETIRKHAYAIIKQLNKQLLSTMRMMVLIVT